MFPHLNPRSCLQEDKLEEVRLGIRADGAHPHRKLRTALEDLCKGKLPCYTLSTKFDPVTVKEVFHCCSLGAVVEFLICTCMCRLKSELKGVLVNMNALT